MRESLDKKEKLKLEKWFTIKKKKKKKKLKFFSLTKNVFGMTIFGRTKYRKIEKTFFIKHFMLKQT
jgi:hypothetical protein